MVPFKDSSRKDAEPAEVLIKSTTIQQFFYESKILKKMYPKPKQYIILRFVTVQPDLSSRRDLFIVKIKSVDVVPFLDSKKILTACSDQFSENDRLNSYYFFNFAGFAPLHEIKTIVRKVPIVTE
ncbi:MAG: hypothetical protein ACE5HI_02810 [bacterium]